jgi:hypothetical protein
MLAHLAVVHWTLVSTTYDPAVPEIPGQDIDAAVAYYERNPGFTLDWRADTGARWISNGNCRDVFGELGILEMPAFRAAAQLVHRLRTKARSPRHSPGRQR